MDETRDERQLKVMWPSSAAAALPVLAVNQMSAQVAGSNEPDEVIITFGHVSAPVQPDERGERTGPGTALPEVMVQSVFRMSLSPSRLREFVTVLQTVVQALDEQEGRQA